ncbi:hypothetical protein [Thalassobellus suaedae]|uniref:Uncharacterized protein n=1 Tax=Thalassobellus suaedae TaxID=3074124 RepID=A0ABY9XW12_9FLAO|nr:hypothetical protein RHP51_05525 [Flavobacteriaceae bacterium HL-DH14]
MTKKLAYLLLLTLFVNCKSDENIPDCSTVLCAAPMVVINLVDDTSKENYIIQNNIKEENIEIRDALENPVEFTINEANGLLFVIKHNTEDALEIQIDSEIIATISYNTSAPKTNECCDYGDLINVSIDNKAFKVEDNIITIPL